MGLVQAIPPNMSGSIAEVVRLAGNLSGLANIRGILDVSLIRRR